ncbi:hypothetical protein CI109_103662 [Kwoniella shandongensis]|uniref:Uncharacterized protein n=1 Tax=Kwoniella shandongensis TaxID=1734106 RepID=A0A5M6C7W3_9TREE|nr:uncharacterized protein CI109_000645 [Kwoniella shandongensis]KAA5531073.1 hypothetical protein CI109_000645 [Kwoniella shandongensis]
MSTRSAILASLLAATSAFAHCQLAWPYALHSPLNPATPEAIKDYSMTSPLVSSGTYPCKGYINNPSSDMYSRVTWSAGATVNYTIAGTAVHGGGSCQTSMSYDNGATWNVIFSYVGGCLIEGMTTEITIPTDAPSGEALFAWGWFNLQGNREMYHNCAPVTITNGGGGLNANDYPTPFVANAGVNDCKTIEGTAVVFPNPGKNVRYGGSYAGSQPTTAAGFTGSNCVGPGATASSSSPSTGGSDNSTSSSSSSSAAAPAVSAASSATYAEPSSATEYAPGNSTTAAATAETTFYSVSLSATGTTLDPDNNIAAAPTASLSATQPKTCKSKRNNNDKADGQRLVRRARSGGKRVAAMPATHPKQSAAKRDLELEERSPKRVAASKAEHLVRGEKRSQGGTKRVAAKMATHNV